MSARQYALAACPGCRRPKYDCACPPEMACTSCETTDHTVARRFDKHGIYVSRYCDPCWAKNDPGDYDDSGEVIEPEADSSGDGLA
jgi:hypothetical protein